MKRIDTSRTLPNRTGLSARAIAIPSTFGCVVGRVNVCKRSADSTTRNTAACGLFVESAVPNPQWFTTRKMMCSNVFNPSGDSDRYATLEVGEEWVIYDRENHQAWIQSDYTVEL